MEWTTTSDVTAFDAAAGDFLRSRPAQHTAQLTVCARLRQQGPHAFGEGAPEFGWWTGADGSVNGAYLRTPPHNLLLTELPTPAVAPLVDRFATVDPALPGVTGPVATAEAFDAAWQRATGARPAVARSQRLYRLGELTPPPAVAGQRGRLAGPGDRALLVDWWTRFAQVIGEPQPYHADRTVDDRLGYGGVALWEDGGRPVSLGGATRQVAGMVRIAPVYTPEPERGRGYASRVTALVCRQALDAGAREVLLFTDLANPTSNALYQRLGFRAVRDFSDVRFQA